MSRATSIASVLRLALHFAVAIPVWAATDEEMTRDAQQFFDAYNSGDYTRAIPLW